MMTIEQKKKIRDALRSGSPRAIDEVISELCKNSRPPAGKPSRSGVKKNPSWTKAPDKSRNKHR
jgi:hypothetical protein